MPSLVLCDNTERWHGREREAQEGGDAAAAAAKSLSRVRLCAIPWTAAHQAPPSMGFSRQESWSGVPLPSPGEI